jgi:hypothetical protein
LAFLGSPNGPISSYKGAHEGDIFMSIPAGWCGKSSVWAKLSNSGEDLKLITLNQYINILSGWINYSCIVTAYKIIEKAMVNRGSKSKLIN